jgi:hypothetical protein
MDPPSAPWQRAIVAEFIVIRASLILILAHWCKQGGGKDPWLEDAQQL